MMLLTSQKLTPSAAETHAFFQEYLGRGTHLLQVAGEFEITYSGRAQSTAEAGDFLLILKPDGCLMIHAAKGIKPRNWQPTTDSLTSMLETNTVILRAERHRPLEVLAVKILSCVTLQAFCLREETSFLLSGSEADMKATLRVHPELIEPGLTILDEELPTHVGSIDLFAKDARGNLVVIELKRGKATHEGVHQLSRYVQKVQALQTTRTTVRGILVAPDATQPALKQLELEQLEFRRLSALPERERESPQASLF